MKIIEGLTLLEHIINRISHSSAITKIIIATTTFEDMKLLIFAKIITLIFIVDRKMMFWTDIMKQQKNLNQKIY